MNIWKCYILIELSIMKELMLIKQVHQKSLMFVTVDVSSIKVLSFNSVFETDAMIMMS